MKVDLARIKAERVAKGLTQENMAKQLGWSRSTYAKRENGIVPIGADELANIASILNINENQMGIFFKFNVPKKERL